MTHINLQDFYNTLVDFANAKDEAGAGEFLKKNFDDLPEDVQGEILTQMYFSGAREEAEEATALGALQEKGFEALKAMEVLEKKLKAEA